MNTYELRDPPPWEIGTPSSLRRAGTLSLLGALSAFGPLSMDMYLPATPTIAASLHANQSLVQLTMSGCLAGLALGQLIAGPLSDSLGRKRPLLVGLTAFVGLSAVCAVAPTIEVLIALRFLQGMAGAVGVVLSLAMVRDLYDGSRLTSALASLALVFGLMPVVAPVIGGQVLRFTSWRGVFGVLAATGAVLLLASLAIPETLPEHRRRSARFRQILTVSRTLFADPQFTGNALAVGFGTGALITYITSIPFIIEVAYHQSPQVFSALFAINALGLTAMAQLGSWLARRTDPVRITRMALAIMVTSGVAFCALTMTAHATGHAPLQDLLVPLFGFVAALGMMRPNATALAMERHQAIAGTASAYLGSLQFTLGAAFAPLAGLGGQGATIPTGIVIALLCVLAIGSQTLVADESPLSVRT